MGMIQLEEVDATKRAELAKKGLNDLKTLLEEELTQKRITSAEKEALLRVGGEFFDLIDAGTILPKKWGSSERYALPGKEKFIKASSFIYYLHKTFIPEK
ncbi:hypothetical protein ACFLZ2_03540 [Candidatus Margulisiibacteriota bacterium]